MNFLILNLLQIDHRERGRNNFPKSMLLLGEVNSSTFLTDIKIGSLQIFGERNMETYKKDVAFVNRNNELKFLSDFIDTRPESILFIHGPKSSGKTTLLYHFFEIIQKKERLDIKFLNLREILIVNYKDFLNMNGCLI